MGSSTPTHRGKLKLIENKRSELPTLTAAGPIESPTQGMTVSPQTFDSTLSLNERFMDFGEISRGGMSSIRLVLEKTFLRNVAMKVMSPDLSLQEEYRLRFIKEAQITGQLEHPNIVPVYELGVDDQGTHFFTMKLIQGRTLSTFIKQEYKANPDDYLYRTLHVFLRVCDAVAFAHSRGVLHRDIKPSNIMVGEHGQVYLMDWGIAYLKGQRSKASAESGEPQVSKVLNQDPDAPGTVLGTYAYMPPEQALGLVEELDERSDVFSLGAVLYFILTGRPPYRADEDEELLDLAQRCHIPPPWEILTDPPPQVLSRISMHALSPAKADRHQSVSAFRNEIEEVLRGRWRFPTVNYKAGEQILTEGERGDQAYVIRTGECEVYRVVDGHEQILITLKPGDVFGETAVFTGQPRNASVRALEDTELWEVAGENMLEELGLDSWMGAFVSSLGKRFSDTNDEVARLRIELVKGQIQRSLVLLIARSTRVDEDGMQSVSWEEACEAIGTGDYCTEQELLETIAAFSDLEIIGQGASRRILLAKRTT